MESLRRDGRPMFSPTHEPWPPFCSPKYLQNRNEPIHIQEPGAAPQSSLMFMFVRVLNGEFLDWGVMFGFVNVEAQTAFVWGDGRSHANTPALLTCCQGRAEV